MSLAATKEAQKAQLKAVMVQMNANTDPDKPQEEVMDQYLDALFDIFEVWIKSATVTVNTGVTTVVVGGSATGGPVTGTGSGSGSGTGIIS